MGYLNRVILTGRLTADPELKLTDKEVPVAHFRVAAHRPWKNAEGKHDADFINISAWNGLAKVCGDHLKKGQMVALEGRLQVSSYEKNGQKLTYTEVVADNLHMVDFKTYTDAEKVAVAA